jgi:hypothetical protein
MKGKSKAFLKMVNETWVQSGDDKAAERAAIPSKLPHRMKFPIQFD